MRHPARPRRREPRHASQFGTVDDPSREQNRSRSTRGLMPDEYGRVAYLTTDADESRRHLTGGRGPGRFSAWRYPRREGLHLWQRYGGREGSIMGRLGRDLVPISPLVVPVLAVFGALYAEGAVLSDSASNSAPRLRCRISAKRVCAARSISFKGCAPGLTYIPSVLVNRERTLR